MRFYIQDEAFKSLQADISETKRDLGKSLYKSCRISWGKKGNNRFCIWSIPKMEITDFV